MTGIGKWENGKQREKGKGKEWSDSWIVENIKKRSFTLGVSKKGFESKFPRHYTYRACYGVRWKLHKSYKNSWDVKIGALFFLFFLLVHWNHPNIKEGIMQWYDVTMNNFVLKKEKVNIWWLGCKGSWITRLKPVFFS